MTSRDDTFRGFTPEQAAAYADGRGGAYPAPIYQTILDFHKGERKLVLDVGTGPGKAVWDLVAYFDRAIGCDTSEQMISQAKKDAEQRGLTDKTAFTVCSGDECDDALSLEEVGKVDLVTLAMAAHWMDDLPTFYASVAKALKPGGTLAMWTASSYYCHPSTPNHKAVQAVLSHFEDEVLLPFMTPGNLLSKHGYDELDLPWSLPNTAGLFDEATITRRHWDRDGIPSSAPLADGSPGPFLFGKPTSLEEEEKGFSSASAVVRYREANAGLTGTEDDVVKVMTRDLRRALGEHSQDELVFGPSCSLLLMRKAE